LTVVTVAGSWFDSGFITAADVVVGKLGEHVPGCASCFVGVQGCGDGEDAVALADVTGADVFPADGLRESRCAVAVVAVVVGAGRLRLQPIAFRGGVVGLFGCAMPRVGGCPWWWRSGGSWW